MKNTVIICLLLICSGCSQDLKNTKKVADVYTSGKHEIVVCDRSLLKDTVILPLSYFTEEMQMVKLENSEHALVSTNSVIIGEKYILVKGSGNNPYKLFTREGRFITRIGSYGKGPGEYRTTNDEIMDEKNNRIYIFPWGTQTILVYDLTGKILDPIRLPMNVSKGKLFVDPSGTMISVIAIPWMGSPYVAWTQKMSGEIISSIAPGHLAIDPRDASGAFTGYNNDVMTSKNTSSMDVYLFAYESRQDTLYHYDTATNQLIPRFTMNFESPKIPIHSYVELPDHYLGNLAELKIINDHLTDTQNNTFFFVEKSTLKGSFFKLKNDYFGDLEIGGPSYAFSNGYYVRNYDPGDLLEDLEKVLSGKNITEIMRQKLTQLRDTVSEGDNNYIFYAKLKKS
ncbi:MAG: 6-bladed beta-propeller [Bacteroidales bacterium]|jgi:hypothetical protein|nr:6-bladed beta-propeller [Bacteroidales bacterium]